MLTMEYEHGRLGILDLVSNPVIPDTDPIFVFISFQFDATSRSGIFFESQHSLKQAGTYIGGEAIQLLLNRPRDDDSVLHQSPFFERSMYSSMVR